MKMEIYFRKAQKDLYSNVGIFETDIDIKDHDRLVFNLNGDKMEYVGKSSLYKEKGVSDFTKSNLKYISFDSLAVSNNIWRKSKSNNVQIIVRETLIPSSKKGSKVFSFFGVSITKNMNISDESLYKMDNGNYEMKKNYGEKNYGFNLGSLLTSKSWGFKDKYYLDSDLILDTQDKMDKRRDLNIKKKLNIINKKELEELEKIPNEISNIIRFQNIDESFSKILIKMYKNNKLTSTKIPKTKKEKEKKRNLMKKYLNEVLTGENNLEL